MNDASTSPLGNNKSQSSGLAWTLRTIFGGMLFIFPFIILIALFQYVYFLLHQYLVEPIAWLVVPDSFRDSVWFYFAPLFSILAVLLILFLFGLLFRTRVQALVKWGMERVPGVATLYSAIYDTLESLQGPPGLANVDTVVLVPFPQAEMRMAGYLMTTNEDPDGTELVSVYIPIVLFPPSGYTVVVPKDQVTFTDWPTKDVWKLLLSGGLTLPKVIPFQPQHGTSQSGQTSGTAADEKADS